LEREKEIQRLQAEKERLLQQERERQAKEERERQLAQQKAEKERLEKERLEKEKQQLEAKRKEQEKRQAAIRAAENRRAEELRQEQLRRMTQLAGGGGGQPGGSSNAPSENYAGRIRARVKPNITYTHTGSDNPHAIAEVRTAPDGTIVGVRIAGPSGNPAWDEAVVRALHKTEILPRDIDGRVPPHIIIGFRPRE